MQSCSSSAHITEYVAVTLVTVAIAALVTGVAILLIPRIGSTYSALFGGGVGALVAFIGAGRIYKISLGSFSREQVPPPDTNRTQSESPSVVQLYPRGSGNDDLSNTIMRQSLEITALRQEVAVLQASNPHMSPSIVSSPSSSFLPNAEIEFGANHLLMQTLNEKDRQLMDLISEKERVEAELIRCQSELEQALHRENQFQRQTSDDSDWSATSYADVDGIASRAMPLHMGHKGLTERSQELKKENARLEDELQRLLEIHDTQNKDIQSLQKKVAQLEAEQRSSKQQTEQDEQTLEQLSEEIFKLKDRIEALERLCPEAESVFE